MPLRNLPRSTISQKRRMERKETQPMIRTQPGPILQEAIRTALHGPRATSIVMHPDTLKELKAEVAAQQERDDPPPQWINSPALPQPVETGPTETDMLCGKSVIKSTDLPHGVFLLAGHVDPVPTPQPKPVAGFRARLAHLIDPTR